MICDEFFTKVLNPNLTEDEAIEIAKYITSHYDQFTDLELAYIQINQKLLVMDFGRFHTAIEHILGEPVFTHEFGIERCVERMRNKVNKKWGCRYDQLCIHFVDGWCTKDYTNCEFFIRMSDKMKV